MLFLLVITLQTVHGYGFLPLPPLIFIRFGEKVGFDYSGFYHLVAQVSLQNKSVYPKYERAGEPQGIYLYNQEKIWRLSFENANGLGEAFNLINTNRSRIPPTDGWQKIITAWNWNNQEKKFILSIENSDLAPANVDIYFYPHNISVPPARITILSSLSEKRSGEYILMASKHNGFPVYGGHGHDTFIYVSKYNIEVLKVIYIWVIGFNISDYQGEIISFPVGEDNILSYFPPISPTNWPDWKNVGTQEEILLQPNRDQIKEKTSSTLICNKNLDNRGIKYRNEHISSLLLIQSSDRRRCNAHPDCEGGEDELH